MKLIVGIYFNYSQFMDAVFHVVLCNEAKRWKTWQHELEEIEIKLARGRGFGGIFHFKHSTIEDGNAAKS
jgi:hypothetical protein